MAQTIDDRQVYIPQREIALPAQIPPPPANVPPAQPQETLHPVAPQDTLASIGERYGVAPERIAERNLLDDPDVLDPGTTLVVPTGVEHPEPAIPAATPEQAAVDTALEDALLARDNLAAMQGTSGQNGGQPWPADAIAAQERQVTSTGEALETALGDQIRIELLAGGQPVDAASIQQRGDALLQRYGNDPAAQNVAREAVTDVRTSHEVDTTLAAARAAPDARGVVDAIDSALPALSPEAQSALLSSPELDTLLTDRVTGHVTEPLANLPGDRDVPGPGQSVLDTFSRLDAVTRDVDPRLATALADQALDRIERLNLSELGWNRVGTAMDAAGADGRYGILTLNSVAGRIAGTPEGDAQVARLAGVLDNAEGQGIRNLYDYAIPREGASPALALAYAARTGNTEVFDSTLQAVADYARSGQLGDAVNAHAAHTEELTHYIAAYGGQMTPEELNDAITEFTNTMGTAWQDTANRLEADAAQAGLRQLEQIAALQNLPPELASRQGDADRVIGEVLGSQHATYAMSLAQKLHPEFIDTTAGRRLMQESAYEAKFGEQGLKFGRELANTYIRQHVLTAAENFDPANPASRATALAAIDELKSPRLAALLGVSDSKLANAADALKNALPDGTDVSPESYRARLDALNRALTTDDLKPAFDKGLPAGQLIRALGLTFAAVGFANSSDKALNDPTLKNALKVIVDGASLGQKGLEIGVGLGKISNDSLFGRFGSTTSGRVFGVLSAGFDGWNAGESFAAGDPLGGSLWTASAAGGLLAATSGTSLAASLGIGAWAGPVGLALVGISALGLAAKDRNDFANRFQHDETSGRSTAFLDHSSLNTASARALTDNSGEGYSPVPLLTRYGELHGLNPQQTAEWINNLPPAALERLRDVAHVYLDEHDGNIAGFADSAPGDAEQLADIQQALDRRLPLPPGSPDPLQNEPWLLGLENVTVPESAAVLDRFMELWQLPRPGQP